MSFLSGNAIAKIDRSDPRYVALYELHNRLARKDATMWGVEAAIEAHLRLNWIDLPETSRQLLPVLDALCAKHRDKVRVVLCGMGGSSLGPEVIAKTSNRELFIVDSTDPNYIEHALVGDLSKTLVIVSSKSGSTIETSSALALFESTFSKAGLDPKAHIVIVTDPFSPLDIQSRENGYSVINADPNVGGRFSVLTAFGLTPAALIGVDVSVLLDSASETKAGFLKDPTVVLDMAYAIAYISGQYMSFCDEGSSMPGLSDWIEQLIAESTGKNHIGRLPIVIESADQSEAFSITFNASADLVLTADLASQFIIWEWVVALVGAVLGIDPFNQPNVAEAKTATSVLLEEWKGVLPHFLPEVTDRNVEIFGKGVDLKDSLALLLNSIPSGGYIAVMAYLDRIGDVEITELRALLSKKSGRPTTFGWAPRFLHSTGQFHKGGQQNGAFLQITGNSLRDIEIPGQVYGFKTLVAAQALGDAKALSSRKLPLLRLNLINRVAGIDELLEAVREL